jgi:hypothetical protein
VRETPAIVALQVGSGLVFVLLWRLSRRRWSQLARKPYFWPPLDSVLGAVPLAITAIWLAIGVLEPVADGALGTRPTDGAKTIWFAIVLAPIGLAVLAFLSERPVWLQPPGRWLAPVPKAKPAPWWRWAHPSLFSAALLLSAGVAASNGAWAPAGAYVLTLLIVALGCLVPLPISPARHVGERLETVTPTAFVCSGFATATSYSAREVAWTAKDEFPDRRAARAAARRWLGSQGRDAVVEVIRVSGTEGVVDELVTQTGMEPVAADDNTGRTSGRKTG